MIDPTRSPNWLWGWLKFDQHPYINYRHFTHYQIIEDTSARFQVQDQLARLLREYHTHSDVDLSLLKLLGFPLLVSALAKDQRPYNWATRSGNLTEILCCEFCKALNYVFPVVRLQFNTNPDQSMKGDDVLGFQFAGEKLGTSDIILIGEAKFRSIFATTAVEEAHKALQSGSRPYPNSLEFIVTILRLKEEYDLADRVEQLGRRMASNQLYQSQKQYLIGLGTINQPTNPFEHLEQLGDDSKLLPNLVAVNFVFQAGFREWLTDVYDREDFVSDGHTPI